jgi:hypothetical protein
MKRDIVIPLRENAVIQYVVYYKISLEDSETILITQKLGVLRISFMISSVDYVRDAVGIMGHLSTTGIFGTWWHH